MSLVKDTCYKRDNCIPKFPLHLIIHVYITCHITRMNVIILGDFRKVRGHLKSLVYHPSICHKNITWTILSDVLMMEHSYMACVILVIRPFIWYYAVTLTFDLFMPPD